MGTLKVVKKDEVKVQSMKKSFLKHYCRHANTFASQRDYNVSANGYMLALREMDAIDWLLGRC